MLAQHFTKKQWHTRTHSAQNKKRTCPNNVLRLGTNQGCLLDVYLPCFQKGLKHTKRTGVPGSILAVVQFFTSLLPRGQHRVHAGKVPRLRTACISQVWELHTLIQQKWEAQVAETTPASSGMVEMWPRNPRGPSSGPALPLPLMSSVFPLQLCTPPGDQRNQTLKRRKRKVFPVKAKSWQVWTVGRQTTLQTRWNKRREFFNER